MCSVTDAFAENPNLIYAILRSAKRFQALREFTLESGQEEIERQNQLRKDEAASIRSPTRTGSVDSQRTHASARTPSLSNVPEEGSAFAIGDDEEDEEDDDIMRTPSRPTAQSANASRTASISSTADDAVPLQVRGMSEKARGKMPVGQTSFSRQNSTTSLASLTAPALLSNGAFTPSVEWVSASQSDYAPQTC